MITSDREDPVPPSKSLQENHRSRNHDERDMWPGSLPIEMRTRIGNGSRFELGIGSTT